MLIALKSQEELQSLLEKNNLVLDFYADWCPPCRQLMPILEKVSINKKFKDILFIKINISLFGELFKKYEITSLPTLIFYSCSKNQKEKHIGFINEGELISLLEKFFF